MMDCRCCFVLEFEEDAKEFCMTFEETNAEFCMDFGEMQIVHTDYDPYLGPYVVTPKRRDQILATNGKNMEDDVTVKEVPWTEVSNPTGTTFTIAAD